MDPTADRSAGVDAEQRPEAGGVATAQEQAAARHEQGRARHDGSAARHDGSAAHEDRPTASPDPAPGPHPGRGLAPDRDPAAIAADAAAATLARGSKGSRRAARRRRPRLRPGELWRSALSPRMIGFLVLLLAAAVVCVQLSAWQFDRAALRGAERAVAAHEATLSADPVPLEDVLRTQTSFGADVYATGVSVTGEWEQDHQVLVVDRAVEGAEAVLVVTSLRLTDGPDAGAMLPVLRGWLPADQVEISAEGAVAEDPGALTVPDGQVEVVGHLSNSEQVRDGSTAPGTELSISSGALAGAWGGPTFSGYLVQGAHDGEGWVGLDDGLTQAPDPTIAVDTGFNLQNLAYAVEWLVFGGFALWLWWRLVRDDALDRRDEELLAAAEPRRPHE